MCFVHHVLDPMVRIEFDFVDDYKEKFKQNRPEVLKSTLGDFSFRPTVFFLYSSILSNFDSQFDSTFASKQKNDI
jgi:hypothetical protein